MRTLTAKSSSRIVTTRWFGCSLSSCLGRACLSLFIAASEDSKRLLARARQRKLHADFYGALLIAPMLDEIKARHGPSRDALTKHFATELIGEERGERFARSVELFWEEQYDESAHVLAPRLESVLRELARAVGITIVKPAEEGKFGGVITLGRVMSNSEGSSKTRPGTTTSRPSCAIRLRSTYGTTSHTGSQVAWDQPMRRC